MVTLLSPGDQEKKFWMDTNLISLTLSGDARRFKSPRTFMRHLRPRAELSSLCFRFDDVDILRAELHMPATGMRAWGTVTCGTLHCVISFHLTASSVLSHWLSWLGTFFPTVEWKFLDKYMSCLCGCLCLLGVFPQGVRGEWNHLCRW